MGRLTKLPALAQGMVDWGPLLEAIQRKLGSHLNLGLAICQVICGVLVDAGLIPKLERLEAAITPRIRAIVTLSPYNPSGVEIPQPRPKDLMAARKPPSHFAWFFITRGMYRRPGRAFYSVSAALQR